MCKTPTLPHAGHVKDSPLMVLVLPVALKPEAGKPEVREGQHTKYPRSGQYILSDHLLHPWNTPFLCSHSCADHRPSEIVSVCWPLWQGQSTQHFSSHSYYVDKDMGSEANKVVWVDSSSEAEVDGSNCWAADGQGVLGWHSAWRL